MKLFRNWSIRRKAGLHLLVILLLVSLHLGSVWWFPQEVRQDGAAINEAGQQRMLTKQMALQAHQIGMGDEEKRNELAATAAEFDRMLTALIDGNDTRGIPPAPPAVREQLLVVKSLWNSFYGQVRTVITEPRTSEAFDESLTYIERNHEELLVENDRAVERYEQAYEAKIQQNQQLFSGLLLIDLLVIPSLFYLITWHILRPINRLTATAEAIAGGDFDQPIPTIGSGDEINALSRSLREMKDQLVASIQEIARFEQAVEHAGHAIYITDRDGTIEYVNPAFEKITKYDEAVALGKSTRILKSGHQSRSYYEALWETILAGDVWEDDLVNERASGELFHAHETVAPITTEAGEVDGFVAIMTDNTDQLVSKQQNQVLSRVLRHNLRTELNLIEGYAQELAEEDAEKTREKYLRDIDDRINNLVELSAMVERYTQGFQKIHQDDSQGVCAAVEYVCEMMEEQYPQASISMDLPSFEVDITVNIEIVLEELVENAIKHNDQTTPAVVVTVTLQQEVDPPPTLLVEIEDNGPGIPPDERKVIEQGEETPLFHGSGLGLWGAHWMVTLAGGEISITDHSPRGTRIALTLPRASVAAFPRSTNDDPEAVHNDEDSGDRNEDNA